MILLNIHRILRLPFTGIIVWLLCFNCIVFSGFAQASASRTLPDKALLTSAYVDGEIFRYDIFWLGIKAGELIMQVDRLQQESDRFRITVVAKSAGLLAVFYPVEDRFETIVEGWERFPVQHDFWQKEGSRKNRKITIYNQDKFTITYTRNEEQPIIYSVDGPVHNEFSSFMAMRIMPLSLGKELIVPTFADKKRHAIRVEIQKKKMLSSIFGEVETIQVEPILTFKGLYEKVGDPVIWLTNDEFRVPLRITAKIVIGSLTAKLVEYKGARPMLAGTNKVNK